MVIWIRESVMQCSADVENTVNAQKFSMIYIFSKCDQIRMKPRIWTNLLKKYIIENFSTDKGHLDKLMPYKKKHKGFGREIHLTLSKN